MKPKIKLEDLPDGARINGMGPIGVRWQATWNKSKQRWKPDGGLHPDEFAALDCGGRVIDIPANENYKPYES